MKRIKARTELMVHMMDELVDKGIGQAMGISSVDVMDTEDFMLYKQMTKTYAELMKVIVDWSEAIDNQTEKMETLEKEIKVIQDSIYELTNKVEEVIEKDEITDNKKK